MTVLTGLLWQRVKAKHKYRSVHRLTLKSLTIYLNVLCKTANKIQFVTYLQFPYFYSTSLEPPPATPTASPTRGCLIPIMHWRGHRYHCPLGYYCYYIRSAGRCTDSRRSCPPGCGSVCPCGGLRSGRPLGSGRTRPAAASPRTSATASTWRRVACSSCLKLLFSAGSLSVRSYSSPLE